MGGDDILANSPVTPTSLRIRIISVNPAFHIITLALNIESTEIIPTPAHLISMIYETDIATDDAE